MEDVQEDRTLESSTDVSHPQQQANGSDHLHLFAPPTRRARGDGEMMGPILRRKKVVSLPLGHGGKTILVDETFVVSCFRFSLSHAHTHAKLPTKLLYR